MNIIANKLFKILLKEFYSLNELEGEEFKEGLRKFKEKHPMTSAPRKNIRKHMDIKECRVEGGIYYRAKDKLRRSNKKVLFIHGGGFVAEAMPVHWDLCRRLARDTGCEIIFPQYPLVPESDAEGAHKMLMEVYKEFIKDSDSKDLTIRGDSAGGTFALSLSMLARDRGMKLANEIVLISPGLKMSDLNETEKKRAEYIKKQDQIIGVFPVDKISKLWYGKLELDEKRSDVGKGDLNGLPPITMFSGTHDIMNIPARRLAKRLKKEGHEHIYIEKKGGIHDYALAGKSKMEYDIMVSKIIGK